ncbi:hypothetical protein BpHYR1_047970 [Brachionus plicatilis]|uniref:Uncharacterized protein n=1 Tax=Brachionus plicatilis TaxID=10195 RepID=A0A3M7T9C5_BRAPC|nr:hypothetical protein BpHYR1_047970 [Brachionus plicatilis]
MFITMFPFFLFKLSINFLQISRNLLILILSQNHNFKQLVKLIESLPLVPIFIYHSKFYSALF